MCLWPKYCGLRTLGPNYNGLESPMLHTKFRGNQPTGSWKEAFKVFLPYMVM